MKFKINTYFAVLLITISGAIAAILIVQVASADTFEIMNTRYLMDITSIND